MPHCDGVAQGRFSRNYGFKKLGELVRKQSYLEVKETLAPSGLTPLQVRLRTN